MDIEEVKACLRGLLSSTSLSCSLNNLLYDFRKMTGLDLPLFGHLHPVEFLRTLGDTVQLFGNPYNPEVALVQSDKSAHITSLVDRQKLGTGRHGGVQIFTKPKRLVVPNLNHTGHNYSLSSPYRNSVRTNVSQRHTSLNKPEYKSMHQVPVPLLTTDCSPKFISSQVSKTEGETEYENVVPAESNPCLDDISDCENIEDFQSGGAMDNSCFVNDGIKKKLQKLIRDYPEGLWCCELPKLFQDEYNFALDYREYGYTSLIQMLSELPEVFRCLRPGNEDWLLFDASVAPSPEEKRMMDLQETANINSEVTANLRKLLFVSSENVPENGFELERIEEMYKRMFGRCLDFRSLGFKDFKSCLKIWEGNLFSLHDRDGKTYLVPESKGTVVQKPIRWKEALPPITAENDIFVEIFPKEVVGPEESLPQLDLAKHILVGNVVGVSVAEVWSPGLFYLQLNKFKSRLVQIMEDLQKFYNVHLNKYKMPDSTIRPKQVCVGLYTLDPDLPDEWHRAQIVKVINERVVLVNFVDYGTETRLKKTHLRFLHRSFQWFPVQGILAHLSGIVPVSGEDKWPISTSKRFLELVRVPHLEAKIMDIDFKKPQMSVVLYRQPQKSEMSINKTLILENLACMRETFACRIAKQEEEAEQKTRREHQKETGTPSENGAKVQEGIRPEKSSEFSDIADLGHSTFFRMRKLANPSLGQSEKEGIGKSVEGLKCEFDDIPDLEEETAEEEKEEKEEKGEKGEKGEEEEEVQENTTSVISEGKKSSKSPSPPPSPPFSASLRPECLEPWLTSAVAACHLSLPPALPLPVRPRSPVPQPDPPAPPSPRDVPEPAFVPLPGKPKRLPPGLERPKVLSSIADLLPPSDDLRKKINILAMEFLTTHASIKEVGVNDPNLAVKIATEMAEACILSQRSAAVGFGPVLTQGTQSSDRAGPRADESASSSEEVPEITDPPPSDPAGSDPPPAEKSPRKAEKENEYVTETKIKGKTLHMVTIDNEFYFCAEQIVGCFTVLTGREVADRILHIKKIPTAYRIITKTTDEKILNAIKRSQLPVVKKKSKKPKIYLLPIGKVVPYLRGLGCNTQSIEIELQKLQSAGGKETGPQSNKESQS